MKQFIILLIASLVLFSCDDKFQNKKPEQFIEKDKMEDILFDLKLFQAARSRGFKQLKDNNFQEAEYIYHKYQIDSATLTSNLAYYSTNYKAYRKMEENIRARFVEKKAEMEEIIKEEEAVIKAQEAAAKELESISDELEELED